MGEGDSEDERLENRVKRGRGKMIWQSIIPCMLILRDQPNQNGQIHQHTARASKIDVACSHDFVVLLGISQEDVKHQDNIWTSCI